jgi:hypothetical protein
MRGSGILPLSISISTLIEHNIFSRDFRQYFDLIAKHVRRWKHIRFQLEDWRLMRIPLGIDANDLPCWKYLASGPDTVLLARF